jgi:hypothetical protein
VGVVNPCTREESNGGCGEAPEHCVESRIRCLHPVEVVGLLATVLRRWAQHGGGFLGVVLSASLVSLSALDRVKGFDVYMCADVWGSSRGVPSSLSSLYIEWYLC